MADARADRLTTRTMPIRRDIPKLHRSNRSSTSSHLCRATTTGRCTMTSRSRGKVGPKLPPSARGLDTTHRNNRQRAIDRHTDGIPCWWCGKPMFRDRTKNHDYNPHAIRRDGKIDTTSGALSHDHTRSRAKHGTTNNHANRLLHGLCNKQRGDGSRDHLRPAITRTTDTPVTNLGTLAMAWPW